MAIKHPITWINYMNELFGRNVSLDELNIKGIETVLNLNHNFHPIFNHSVPMIYLADYTSGKYLLMSKSVKMAMGYDPADFISEGIAFTIENYHKDDMRLFNEEIFPERLKILKSIPADEQTNYLFSYNYRYRNKKKEYSNFLQRNCFIKSDEKGNPLLSLGIITNVSHFVNESPIIQVVEKLNQDPLMPAEIIHKKAFYLNNEGRLFTKREKEVLFWSADGLTTKEIADKLFSSENTIKNHRKNMFQKADTRNVSELVSFAIRQGII